VTCEFKRSIEFVTFLPQELFDVKMVCHVTVTKGWVPCFLHIISTAGLMLTLTSSNTYVPVQNRLKTK